MKTYRIRSVAVEAQVYRNGLTNATPILKWIKENGGTAVWCGAMSPQQSQDGRTKHPGLPESLRIKTSSGWMMAYDGYYIVQTEAGSFYPFNPPEFDRVYENIPVEQFAEVVQLPVRSTKRRQVAN